MVASTARCSSPNESKYVNSYNGWIIPATVVLPRNSSDSLALDIVLRLTKQTGLELEGYGGLLQPRTFRSTLNTISKSAW